MTNRRLLVLAAVVLVALTGPACRKQATPQYSVSFDVEELPPEPAPAIPEGPILSAVRFGAAGAAEPKGYLDVNVAGAPGLIVTARAGENGRIVRLAEDPASPGTYKGRLSLAGLEPGDYEIIAEAQGPEGTERLSSSTRLRVVESLEQMALDEINSKLQLVYFETSQHSLSPQAKEILAANAGVLRAAGNFRANVEGHADERGTEEHNRWLGLWRAKEVKDELRDLGISPEQFTLITHGNSRPAVSGTDEASLGRNRRVEIVVTKLP